MENVRKHRDIKLMTPSRRKSHLASGPSYKAAKSFSEHLLRMEMNGTEVKMDRLVYLGL